MARLEASMQRWTNWQRWKLESKRGGLGFAHVDLEQPMVDGGGYDAQLPIRIDDQEASLTQQALMTLPSDLRRTVEVYYLGPGSLENRLGLLFIAKATLFLRLARADYKLSVWFSAHYDKLKARREQDERSQLRN